MVKIEKILNVPIDIVWKAITDKEHIKKWSFDYSEHYKLMIGNAFEWYGGPPDGKQWLHRAKILEIIENSKFSYSWEYPGYTGYSIVTWQLKSLHKNQTQLNFSHEFVIPFDLNETALKTENFIAGWDSIINELLPNYLAGNEKK